MKYVAGLALSALLLASGAANAQQGEIKVGEINSYSALPGFTEPYRKGMELALKQINDAGGIKGKKLVVITKDDGGKPGDALTAANELVSRDGVVLIAGGFLSNIGLALSDFAKQKEILYIAAEPLTDAIVWSKGNDYTFRLRPSNYMQASMLAEEAAKLPAKRWVTVAPNYEYGQSAVQWFQQLLQARRPDVTFVGAQWPAQGKLEAGSTVQALAALQPEAIFNVTFGADLAKFVREGNTRGLFQGREVVSLLTGEPEYLDPLKDETPNGWIVTGYPWHSIQTPDHKAFLAAYQARYKDYPRLGSVVGYTMIHALAAGIRKAGSTDTEKLIAAFRGLSFDSPYGKLSFRALDHQSTMGAFVGRTRNDQGKGVMVDARYQDGAAFQPSNDEVRKLRAAD